MISNFAPGFHVGQQPYLRADRVKAAGYQLLNEQGRAIALIDVEDGRIQRSMAVPGVDVAGFREQAMAHFAATAPIDFMAARRAQCTSVS